MFCEDEGFVVKHWRLERSFAKKYQKKLSVNYVMKINNNIIY